MSDLQEILSPYYGALTQTAINDITVKVTELVLVEVAAELRRQADEATRRFPHLPPYGLAVSSLELLNRAAELDGGVK